MASSGARERTIAAIESALFELYADERFEGPGVLDRLPQLAQAIWDRVRAARPAELVVTDDLAHEAARLLRESGVLEHPSLVDGYLMRQVLVGALSSSVGGGRTPSALDEDE